MKRYFQFFIVMFALAFVYTGCKKDELPHEGMPSAKVYSYQTLSGVVIDETGLPIAGVTVYAHGQTYVTGNNGFFLFENLTVTGDRYIVKFEKTGYFGVTKSEVVNPGVPSIIRVAMIADGSASAVSVTFASADGGTVNIPGFLTIDFPANNFITSSGAVYNGNVNVKAAYVDPSLSSFAYFNFGGDQIGENHLDQEVFLKAFSSMFVEITDDAGNHLNLNPNAKADAMFELTIPPALLAIAPEEIGIWSFDDGLGVKSMNVASPTGPNSTANKNTNTYRGALGHFSYIGCEVSYANSSQVKGQVIDGNGSGVPGVLVTVGQNNVITDEQGYYSSVVPSGEQIDVGIFPTYYGTPVSTTITPFGTTVVNLNVPTLVTISGTFVDCDGLPTAANVVLENGSLVIETYTSSGEFSVQIPSSPSITAWVYGNDAMINNTFPATADVNFGNVELCPPPTPPPTGPMYAYLDGGSYMNYQVTGLTHKYGTYYSGMGYTSCSAEPSGGGYVSVSFTGNSTGVYTIGGMNGVYVEEMASGTMGTMTTGTITVTRYDPEWGLIEGTFDGYDGSLHIYGVFSVVRQYNQP